MTSAETRPEAPQGDHGRAIPPWVFGILAAATLAAFAGVLRNGWILFDDPLYVFENPHVNRGVTLEGLRWYLTRPHGGNWHPLTSLSHMLDVQLFGLNPAGHHATSLLLHIVAALLVLFVLHGLTGARWRSALVAGCFALHPLRVESVAWISERKDVLSAVFFLLAIEAYRRWVARPSPASQALLIVTFALGLAAKPMVVTLPLVLILLDVWPLGRLAGLGAARRAPAPTGAGSTPPGGLPPRSLAGLALEKWPLFALAAAASVITFIVQKKTGAVASMETLSTSRRVANALISCWRYVGKTFWPSDLAAFYPHDRGAHVAGAVAAAVGLALVTGLAIAQARRRPWLAVGWLWYLVMLLPVIGLIQVGAQAWADRYAYLPSIGLLVALVWGASELVSRSRPGRMVLATLSIAGLAVFSVATARQVALWKDTRTLFTHALAVTHDNYIAHQCLGDDLLKSGDAARALPHYEEAVRLAPRFNDARNKLGSALGVLGRNDEAIAQFQEALRLGETAEGRHNLGHTYERQGRMDDAIREYQAALKLDPDLLLSLVYLGAALATRNRPAEAEVVLRHALELKPADTETRRLHAVSLTMSGQVEEAIADYREILRRNPDDLDALNNVAWIRATHAEAVHRDGAEAVRLAERARDRSPEPVAVIFSTLAAAYAEAGRLPEAVAACERAIELAQKAGEAEEAARYGGQLERYRAGKPFHFGE